MNESAETKQKVLDEKMIELSTESQMDMVDILDPIAQQMKNKKEKYL